MKVQPSMPVSSDQTNTNLDKSQAQPGMQKPPEPASKAAVNPIKKKKVIKSISELKAIAAKMAPKKPMGY